MAQCDFGTGSVTGNSAPFEAGSASVLVSGNNVTVVSTTTIQAGIYNFVNFTVNTGVSLTVSGGSGPLLIRCTGTATINGSIAAIGGNGLNGTLATFFNPPAFGGAGGAGGGGWGGAGGVGGNTGDAAAVPGRAGTSFGSSSGGGLGGTGTTTSSPFAGAGGGGGGYALVGFNGQASDAGAGGAGGAAYGDAVLATFMTQSSISTNLLGGSGGGGGGARGNISMEGGGGGGGGGGAVGIRANTINFGATALVSVKGGNGGQSTNDGGGAYGGSGGGGSGGSVHLQYLSISGFTAGVNSNVTGGTGGTLPPPAGNGGLGGNGASGRLYSELCGVLTNTITAGTISGSPFCAGETVSIPFTISGTFNAGNVFTAQLSNGSGNFASPVTLGTITSTSAGTISGTIPPGQVSGTGYRIRLISANPALTGSTIVADIIINAIPPAPVFEHIR